MKLISAHYKEKHKNLQEFALDTAIEHAQSLPEGPHKESAEFVAAQMRLVVCALKELNEFMGSYRTHCAAFAQHLGADEYNRITKEYQEKRKADEQP